MDHSGASSLLMTRFHRTKPSNAYWLGRSMEHLAVGGTFGSPLPLSSGILPGSGSIPSSTPSKGRHRLVTDPGLIDDPNEDITRCKTK